MKRIGAPKVLPLILIGDEPQLLARLIAKLSRNRSYLPVLDGPRVTIIDPMLTPKLSEELTRLRDYGVAESFSRGFLRKQ